MSDDLRTRILHVLIDTTPPKYLAMPEDLSRIVTALIRELQPLPPPGLQPDGSYIAPAGIVWRHNGLEWTDDPAYRP